jgi:hypothetical protein
MRLSSIIYIYIYMQDVGKMARTGRERVENLKQRKCKRKNSLEGIVKWGKSRTDYN